MLPSALRYMELRFAKVFDLPSIVQLINEAFSVEAAFKVGERIDIEEVKGLFDKGYFLVLEEGGILQANVYLEVRAERAYLGLLSIRQDRQGSGFGARLMAAAEKLARESECRFIDLRIVNLRRELSLFYEKLGYRIVGEEQLDANVQAKFTQSAHFINMSKDLVHN